MAKAVSPESSDKICLLKSTIYRPRTQKIIAEDC